MPTVLLVENDGDVRASLTEILLARNFSVLTAKNGFEAIRLLTDTAADLMLTDIAIPGMSGAQLARAATLLRPSLRIIYTTGYDLNGMPAGIPLANHDTILQKPILAAALVSAIDSILTSRPPNPTHGLASS
jgi:CheY-like chemotaxis protein